MSNNRFVIDTNVLVSAFVFHSKNPTDVLKRSLSKGNVILSADLIDEYKTTLLDKKFDSFISSLERETELALFIDCCVLIEPTEKIDVCRDKDDNKLLELAVAAQASCIITGDNDLLELNPFRNTPILTPADFLRLF